MVAFDDQEQTLTCATGEAFTFAGYGYVRIERSGIRASGKLTGFRVRLPASATGAEATINGKQERIEKAEGFLQWGQVPKQSAPTTTGDVTDDSAERAASVHCRFQPEEAHLSTGGQKEMEMHLRCVGVGQTTGCLRLVAPPGLKVEPGTIEVAPMTEGQERVVRFQVQAAKDAPSLLRQLRVLPEQG